MADGSAARALKASLSVLGEVGRDQAAAQLAARYAALLDAAAVPSTFRAALARLERLAVSKADVAALDKVRDALSAHSVVSDLGPKYLAVLDRLGLTPAARGARAAANTAGPAPAPESEVQPEPESEPEGTRDELKRRRADRARNLAADPR